MSKQKRHKPEEIASLLKQHEAGPTNALSARDHSWIDIQLAADLGFGYTRLIP